MKSLIIVLEHHRPDLFLQHSHLPTFSTMITEGLYGPLIIPQRYHDPQLIDSLLMGRENHRPLEKRSAQESSADASTHSTSSNLPLLWELLRMESKEQGTILVDDSGRQDSPILRALARSNPSSELKPRINPVEEPEAATSSTNTTHNLPNCRAHATRSRFEMLRRLFADQPWHFALLIDHSETLHGGNQGQLWDEDWLSTLDHEIERTAQMLQDFDEQIVLIVMVVPSTDPDNESPRSEPDRTGRFVLISSLGMLRGEVEEADILDIRATMLALAGQFSPDTMAGKPLVPRDFNASNSDEDDHLVQERLRGLGYLI